VTELSGSCHHSVATGIGGETAKHAPVSGGEDQHGRAGRDGCHGRPQGARHRFLTFLGPVPGERRLCQSTLHVAAIGGGASRVWSTTQ
jgi:hypothetical protein